MTRQYNNLHGKSEQFETKFVNQDNLQKIILEGDSATLVNVARGIAKKIIRISRSQIRNIYGTSKKIEMNLKEDNARECYNKLILLKPKLEYAKGRSKGEGEKKAFSVLVDSLSKAIDMIDAKPERMKNFFNFFEAILAYHRAEGGN